MSAQYTPLQDSPPAYNYYDSEPTQNQAESSNVNVRNKDILRPNEMARMVRVEHKDPLEYEERGVRVTPIEYGFSDLYIAVRECLLPGRLSMISGLLRFLLLVLTWISSIYRFADALFSSRAAFYDSFTHLYSYCGIWFYTSAIL